MEGGFELHHSAKSVPWARKAGLADVAREYEDEPCSVLEGEVPDWLNGSLYHQAGGAFLGETETEFLDGLAHIAAFHFDGKGGVTFANKFMRTKDFREFINSGKRTWGGTAQSAPGGQRPGLFSRAVAAAWNLVGSAPQLPPALYAGFNPNVTTWLISDPQKDGKHRLAAITEADGAVCEFDERTLSTVGSVQTMPTKGMVITNAAHWFLDHEAHGGFHVALNLSWVMSRMQPKFTFKYVIYHGLAPPYRAVAELELAEFSWGGRAKQPVKKRAAYMHTIAQTANHVVLIASCKRIRYQDLLSNHMPNGFFGLFEGVEDPLEFIVFRIVDKATAGLEYVDTIACPPGSTFMVWHLANSFEVETAGGATRIVIDASAGEAPLSQVGVNMTLSSAERHSLLRFEIDLAARTASHTVLLGEKPGFEYDFPNINPSRHLREHRFIFALRNPLSVKDGSSVVKLDARLGEHSELAGLAANEVPTEPIFVSRPGASLDDELDGVVLTEAIDMDSGASALLVCDPRSWSVVARIRAPLPSNFGLHSTWIDRTESQRNQFAATSKF